MCKNLAEKISQLFFFLEKIVDKSIRPTYNKSIERGEEMKKRKKKKPSTLEKVLLITAIINLLTALANLIAKLLN